MKNLKSLLKSTLNKNGYFAIVLISALYILLLAYTAFYAHPNGEDLSKANISKNAGIINAAIDQYITYDGRYMTNILHGLIPPVWANPNYQFVSALFLLSFFIISAYYFFLSIFNLINKKNNLLAFSLSIIFSACYTAIIPVLNFFMFLCAGGIVYSFSASVLLLMIGSIFRLINTIDQKRNIFYLILVIILEIISIGMNEMNLVFTNITVFLFFIYVYLFSKKSNFKLDSIVLIIFCISFSMFSVSSPGIGLDREMNFNGFFNMNIILFSIGLSFKYTFFIIVQWILNSPLNFLLPFLIYILVKKSLNLKILIFAPFLLLPLSLFIISLTNVTYIIPFHDTLTVDNFPRRIQNTGQLFYLIINVSGFFYLDSNFSRNKYLNTSVKIPDNFLKFYLPVVFTILFFLNSTPTNLIGDWSRGRIQSYDYKMQKRYITIQEAKKKNLPFVYLETIYDLPYSITDNVKLSTNIEDQLWVKSYEKYYGIKIIMKD